jgi:hypothetical protein
MSSILSRGLAVMLLESPVGQAFKIVAKDVTNG